jgi:hypothetical protein
MDLSIGRRPASGGRWDQQSRPGHRLCPDQHRRRPRVLWSKWRTTDLGLNFFPAAFNDHGVIVGGDQIYNGGTLQNRNNLIPAGSPYQIRYANAINDNGQIVLRHRHLPGPRPATHPEMTMPPRSAGR